MNTLGSIRVVLVRPTHPGNIGGAARAMKNMGLERLYLVAPVDPSSDAAVARAADAADVLARARVCDELDEAIGDCHFVIGTTARPRRIEWPVLEPRACAARLLHEAAVGNVAVVFGAERAGLTNEELDRCHLVGYIPSSPAYPSLNLAGAVQILAYEIFRAAGADATAIETQVAAPAQGGSGEPAATSDEMAHFYRHLRQVLVQTGFIDPANPRLLMRRLRRLFNRARPDRNELNILRGILTAVQQSARKLDKNGKK